jgi:hypothetical protein
LSHTGLTKRKVKPMIRTIQERWTAIAEAAAECARVANTEPSRTTPRLHTSWVGRMAVAELAFADLIDPEDFDDDALDDLRTDAGWRWDDDRGGLVAPAEDEAAAYLAQRQGDLRTAQGQAS